MAPVFDNNKLGVYSSIEICLFNITSPGYRQAAEEYIYFNIGE